MIKKVYLENWKTHKNSSFEFEKGTNILVGSLGSGKTSVMDGICFALFGTFPLLNSKKISVEETIMNKPQKCDHSTVKLEFTYSGKEYLIERTIHKDKASEAKLYENGKFIVGPKPKDVNEKINELIEMDFNLFSRSVYSEQNQIDFFLKLSPLQRKEKLDELLGLNKYEQARSQSVSISNRIKTMLEDKRKWFSEQKEKMNEKELEDLKEKILKKVFVLKELDDSLLKTRGMKEELRKKLKDLEEKDLKFSSLSENLIKLKAKKEEKENKLNEMRKEKDLSKLSGKDFSQQIKNLEKELKELEAKKKSIQEKQNSVSLLTEKIKLNEQNREQKKKSVPERIRGINELNKMRETIESDLNELKKIKEKSNEAQKAVQKSLNECIQKMNLDLSKMDDLKKHSSELGRARANCPVCRKNLDEKSRNELLEENDSLIKKLSIEAVDLNKEKKEFEKKIEAEINNYEKANEQISFNEKKLSEFELMRKELNAINDLNDSIKALNEKLIAEKNNLELEEKMFDSEKENKIKKEIEFLQKLLEALGLMNELSKIYEEISEKENSIKLLNFVPENLKKINSDFIKANSEIDSLAREISSGKELVSEMEKSLKARNRLAEQLNELEKEINSLEILSLKLNFFINSLKATQSQLRELMVESINHAMDDIWLKVYPYRDFLSAKIEVIDGNYEVIVKEKNGSWVRVEGILSGGERSSVALTLRVALSLVLTQNLSWLILDEPTHNLDSHAINNLSIVLKEHLPEVVDQIFIITHDKDLEKACSGSLYFLERDKANEGATKPILSQIE